MPQEYVISLPEIVLGTPAPTTVQPIVLDAVVISNEVSYWETAFYIGLAISILVFLYKLIRILILIFKNPKTYNGTLTLIQLLNSNTAFSFFRYIFLGELLKNEGKEAVLKHEIIHVKQWHSIDLIYFEMLRILFWFNQLLYMYQNRITILHEFIADAEAVKHENKSRYYQNLLSQVFDTKNISFINPFFNQSLIKKRIVMLQKSKSRQVKLLKYALLIPVVMGMLVYTSCERELTSEKESIELLVAKLESKLEEKDSITITERKAMKNLLRKVFGTNIPIITKFSTNFNFSDVEVPFSVIEQVPVFPGCEGMSNDEQKNCMSEKITMHVGENFNTNLAKEFGLTGRQRISVVFKINPEGEIVDVKSRAPHPALEEEAIRVVNMLPKMIPGKQKGKNITVPYSLPIVFQVAEEKTND